MCLRFLHFVRPPPPPPPPQRAQHSLTTLKSFFPNRSAPKGSELLLVKLPSNKGLAVEFEGKVLGVLDDKVVAKEIFTSYFLDGGKASSLPVSAHTLSFFCFSRCPLARRRKSGQEMRETFGERALTFCLSPLLCFWCF